MVAEPSHQSANQFTQGLTADQLRQVLSWLRPLQQALTLEAENGFKNLQGRQEHFHAFLARQLAASPSLLLPSESQSRLSQMAEALQAIQIVLSRYAVD